MKKTENEPNKTPTFSEYIIGRSSENFYFNSLEQMRKCNTTLEDWFKDMYYDYKILYLEDKKNNL